MVSLKRGDHDTSQKLAPRDRENALGQGSAGSWRDQRVDTTHHFKDAGRRGDHDVDATKYGAKHHHGLIIERRRPTWNTKPMRFVSLHHHSTFSYLDGYQLPEAHVRRATELNMGAMAMTEHGNIDSHVKFEKAAEQEGVRPIFGCEVYMPTSTPEVAWDSPDARTQRKHHLTLIAQTDEGYRNLLALVTKSWEDFYHEPTVTWSNLLEHKQGILVLSGCQGSLLCCRTVGGKGIAAEDASYQAGLLIARQFRQHFGENYFIEVQAFPELDATRRFNRLAGRLARAIGARLVATMDCHYTLLEEAEVQKILHNLRPGERRTIEEQAREWGYNVPLCPPPNDASILRRLVASGLTKAQAIEAIITTADIADAIDVTLPKLPMVEFPVPRGFKDVIEYWRQKLREGWRFRGLDKLRGAERTRYKKQLKHEMELIESKGFVSYFMLVAIGVVHIKDQGIPVGPARGSAAASVAAWLLRITEVDPLRPEFAGLLDFGRFISVDRTDLPDIDLDFPGRARAVLRDFYLELFGEGCVNNVGTFTQFKGKNSLDDVARVFNVPPYEVKRIKDFLIERSSGDMRASSTIEDTIQQFDAPREVAGKFPDLRKSEWLEGNIKGFGIHAAALILSNEPITSVTAVMEREVPKGSGNIIQAVAMDKKDAERQGMVKMDFLGLNTMSVIWDIMTRLGWSLDDLYGLPLDDPEVYKLLQAIDVVGVFQFWGRSQRYVCSLIKPEKFSEIMDCGALCRPGPLHNGAAREYGDIKAGLKRAESKHPALDDILGKTQKQIVYQEQILAIARTIGGFDAAGVGAIRTIIAKKEGEQAFERERQRFIAGAATLHKRTHYPLFERPLADQVFGDCTTSGAYAFNAAHCKPGGIELIRLNAGGHDTKMLSLERLWRCQEARGAGTDGTCVACDGPTKKENGRPGPGVGLCWPCYHIRRKLRLGLLKVRAQGPDGSIVPDTVVRVFNNGIQPLWRLTLSDGTVTFATGDHRHRAPDGSWLTVDETRPGTELLAADDRSKNSPWTYRYGATATTIRKMTPIRVCEVCETTVNVDLSHKDGDPLNDELDNFQWLCRSHHMLYDGAPKAWSRGLGTHVLRVERKEPAEAETVYTVEMEGDEHTYLTGDGLINANCAAYGLISYYTAFFKRYETDAFYAATLAENIKDKDATHELLRDAAKPQWYKLNGVRVKLPDLQRSEANWAPVRRGSRALPVPTIRAGFQSVEGIGEKSAPLVAEWRDREQPAGWGELQKLKGFGPKTVMKITGWIGGEDPFGAFKLNDNIAQVSDWIRAQNGNGAGPLPYPTHTAADLADPKYAGQTLQVFWLGTFIQRNIRDIYEQNRARGVILDPKTVKDPDLAEWAMLTGEDETDQLLLKIDRWKYPKFKEAIFNFRMGQDLLLIRGVRPARSGVRSLSIKKLWTISPDD